MTTTIYARDFYCPILSGARLLAGANVFGAGKDFQKLLEEYSDATVDSDYKVGCLGAACMMWRNTDDDRDDYPNLDFALGYCGLAGRPLTWIEKEEFEKPVDTQYPGDITCPNRERPDEACFDLFDCDWSEYSPSSSSHR